MFYLCLKILLGALNIDFFFFFLLAETLGLRKIDLVKVSPLVGGAEPKRSCQCREHSLTVTWQASAGVGTCITEEQLLCENGDNTYFVETKMCLLRPWHLLKYLIKVSYSSPSSSPTSLSTRAHRRLDKYSHRQTSTYAVPQPPGTRPQQTCLKWTPFHSPPSLWVLGFGDVPALLPFPPFALAVSTSAWARPHLALETSQGWEWGSGGSASFQVGREKKEEKLEKPLSWGGGPCPDLLSDPVPSVRPASPSPPWLQPLGPSSLAKSAFPLEHGASSSPLGLQGTPASSTITWELAGDPHSLKSGTRPTERELQGQAPAICVLRSFPGNSDVPKVWKTLF